jgi:DNA-binding beta-propeller fold protein YncE
MYSFLRFLLVAMVCMTAGLGHAQQAAPTEEEEAAPVKKQPVDDLVHPTVGTTSQCEAMTLTLVNKHVNYKGRPQEYADVYVSSPKSANIHPDGDKYYVNSLEGCATLVYDMKTHKRLKVIPYKFEDKKDSALWSKPSSLYPFTHYTENLNTFQGKPVESAFSHGGRYLWVPFYRRTYDFNAQDPSAIAVIDTKTDEIVKLMETGPLPKMVACSHDGRHLAITHWGNNTVGIVNIESLNPDEWFHEKLLVVDYVLPLNFSMTEKVDRDADSGYCLRGTVFTPDDRYLLVGCMGGNGGIAVIDMQTQQYLGRVLGMMPNVRHLVIRDGYLYLSVNNAGYVQRTQLSRVMDAAKSIQGNAKTATLGGWENCKVGAGARTIELSPSGHFVFAACNLASKLYVVDTRTMTVVTSIAVDSYPVGLDISNDGRFVIVTSQGRKTKGGNAVNIYQVDYAEPEPVLEKTDGAALLEKDGNDKLETNATDTTSLASANPDNGIATRLGSDGNDHLLYYVIGGCAAALVACFLFFRRRRC